LANTRKQPLAPAPLLLRSKSRNRKAREVISTYSSASSSGTTFANFTQTIIVSINYRLGSLGWLATGK
jgi:hypothetical protein